MEGSPRAALARVAAAEPDWQPTTLCTTKLEEHVNARVRRGDPLSPSPQLVNPDAHHFAIRVTRSICVRYSALRVLEAPFLHPTASLCEEGREVFEESALASAPPPKAIYDASAALIALGIATAVAAAYVIWELWLRDKFKDW